MKRVALLLALAAVAAGCATVPITGRRQLSLVSASEILSSSLSQYRSYMGKAKVSGDKTRSAQVTRVGRKIANLIRGDVFGLPGVVADTHCIRISSRLGFTEKGEKDPLRTEKALDAVVEPSEQSAFCHRLVMFGRDVCTARSPKCGECVMREKGLCEYQLAMSNEQ